MADPKYTMADLERAREELNRWSEAVANDSSGNPNKHQSQLKSARSEVRLIESALKASGDIAATEHEALERELDAAFPNAKSKEVVEHKGKRYQRRFLPAERSNSGKTVHEWHKWWEAMP
jgi:hypothetical protein